MGEPEHFLITNLNENSDVLHIDAIGLNIEFGNNSNDGQGASECKVEIQSATEGRDSRKSFVCMICGKKFKHNAGRYNHMKLKHNAYQEEKANIKCLERGCSFSCTYKEKLQLHLSEQHGIVMEISIRKFEDLQGFLQWKEEFERQEKCRFVKKSGSRLRDEGVRVAYYYCSRSGSYVSSCTGVKGCKKKGTSKSSNHCTASLTCIEMPNGKVDVKVCSTHYGHDSNLQHLRLTLSEKYQIAEQLSLGVPREVVLDNLRSSANSDIEKIHLIDLKDIKNIEKAFNIQAVSYEKSTDMYSNLKIWVSSMESSQHCPVLYYNEEGISHTPSHDVTIMLLTTGQIDMVNKFGNGGTFYIATSFTSNKISWNSPNYRPIELYVTTLILIDDMNEAVPVSFMVTNKLETRKYVKFFESLKAKVPDMSANALFTDDEKAVYDAWCSIFKEEPCHLWSNRFVDSDWRDNLVSIPDEEVQVSIYEKLYSYLESTDKDKLENSLDDYAHELQANPTTSTFGAYFTSRYVNFQKFWAGCYGKQHIGINAQLNMELLFNEIVEIGLKRHFDRNSFVRVIQRLLKLVSENQSVRHSKLKRQIQELSTHHSLGMNVTAESIAQESDSSWRVKSLKDPENIFSIVNQQYSDCEYSKCMSFCVKCNTCVHNFYCTCRVYSYDKTMCKHIHAVAFTLTLFPKVEASQNPEDSLSIEHRETKGFNTEIKISNPKLLLLQKELWNHRPSKKKKTEEPPQSLVWGEVSLTPVTNEELHDKSIKRKRKASTPIVNEELHDKSITKKRKASTPIVNEELHDKSITKKRKANTPIVNEELHDKSITKKRKASTPIVNKELHDKSIITRKRNASTPIVNEEFHGKNVKRERKAGTKKVTKENDKQADEEEVKKMVESILKSNQPKEESVKKREVAKESMFKSKYSPEKNVNTDKSNETDDLLSLQTRRINILRKYNKKSTK